MHIKERISEILPVNFVCVTQEESTDGEGLSNEAVWVVTISTKLKATSAYFGTDADLWTRVRKHDYVSIVKTCRVDRVFRAREGVCQRGRYGFSNVQKIRRKYSTSKGRKLYISEPTLTCDLSQKTSLPSDCKNLQGPSSLQSSRGREGVLNKGCQNFDRSKT